MFLSLSCVNCHRVRGTQPYGIYVHRSDALDEPRHTRSGMISNDPQGVNLTKMDRRSAAIKPGCLMPSFGLNNRQLI